jgi:hypothetical protein
LFAFPMWWTVTWTITKFFILGGSKIDNIPFYYQPRLGEGVWFLTCYMKFQFWHLKLLERISIPNIFSDHKKSCKILYLVTANFCRSLNTGHGTSSWDLILSVYFYLNLLSTISKQQFWTLKAEPKSGSAASSFGSGYIHHRGRWHHYNGRDDKIKQVRQIRKIIPFSSK